MSNRFIDSLVPAVLFFFLAVHPAAALPIPSISADIDTDRVAIGETAVLTVTASWTGEADEFTFAIPAPPECRGLQVIGTAQRSMAYRTSGELHQVWEYLFTLKGEDDGAGRIGPVEILYRRRGEDDTHPLATEPLDVFITAVGPGLSAGSILLIIVGSLVGLAIIGLYTRWTIRRYKKKSNEFIADYVKNLEHESLHELDRVRKLKIQGDVDGYLERIWDILADYLEKKYTITISPHTWNEVLGGERASALPPDSGTELARILKELEEIRFGSLSPENRELDAILKRVYGFIESQKEHSSD